jgi:hypothetical protein
MEKAGEDGGSLGARGCNGGGDSEQHSGNK